MRETKKWVRWIYWFAFAVAVIFVFKSFDNFSNSSIWVHKLISVLMPFLMAILVAYLFYIPCKQIEQLYKKNKFLKKRARGLSVMTVYIMTLMAIVILVNIIIPAISGSVTDLANNLPGYYNKTAEYVKNLPENGVIKKENIEEIITNLKEIDITKLLSLENISEYIKKVVGVANTIFSIFVTFIVSIYILLERGSILNFIKRLNSALFTKKVCRLMDSYFVKANNVFFKFVSSQVLDALIVGTIVSIALYILRVKYWVLLGFMIGLFNIIPYFGAIVAVVVATLITIFTGGFAKALWMLIIVVILQQIDANIINPKIVGDALKLSPILVIFAVTVFGAYFGILGMFLGVPVIAIIKIVVDDFIQFRIDNRMKQ